MEDKQRASRWFLLLADAISMIAAYIMAYYIRFYSPLISVVQMHFISLAEYMKLLIYLVPVYLLINDLLKVYTPRQKSNNFREMSRLLLTNVLCIFCFFLMLYIMKVYNISRIFLMIFVVINVVFGFGIRVLFSHFYVRKS